jgi:hypothetical protein
MGDPDTGKTRIVTHQRPHLDEVVGIWLLTNFDPACKDFSLEFIPYFGTAPVGDNVVTLGIGGGKYDEHRLKDAGTSATELIYNDLMHRGLIPNNGHEVKALEWLVRFATNEDNGVGYGQDDDARPFHIANIVRSHRDRTNSDDAAIRFGMEIISDVMVELNARATFLKDWESRIEFETKWGKGVAVATDYGRSDAFAYSQGFVLRVNKHLTDTIASIKSDPKSNVDLTEAFAKASELEPTSWYLHQSKKMLISSVSRDSDRTPTSLTLQQLIELVKN